MSGKRNKDAEPGPRAAPSGEKARDRRQGPWRRRIKGLARLAGDARRKVDLQWALLGALALALALALTPGPWGLGSLPVFLGLSLICFLMLGVVLRSWLLLGRGPCLDLSPKDMVFLGCLLLLGILLARGYFLFAGALTAGGGGVTVRALAFGTPLGVGPLLTALFLGPAAGMLMALCSGVLAAMLWPNPVGAFLFFLVSGVAGARLVGAGRTRLDLITCGLRSAGAGLPALAGLALWRGWVISADFPAGLIAAGMGAVLGGVLAAGLAPLAEMIFGYTTDAQYLELGSLDHPALRELMLRAPGTYHHSLVVGSLVEAAAREIGANHLLARVAALYHDLGKLRKADYFVENQMGRPNRHEKLAPSMSALILISHVKEGVETAKRYKLSQPIIDIMAQHHGARLIHFFYNKAQDCRRRAGRDEPDPEAFRYPGPPPQTREAALVMLADTAEAACRALDNPTPARIKGVVQTEINKIFSEGQLNECDLTLKDLHQIAKSFNNILIGIFHQRVEYPAGEEKAGRRNGDNNRQPGGPEREAPERASGQDRTDLKRLGML